MLFELLRSNLVRYPSKLFIEGTVDFIFGASTAVFDSCTIFCKRKGYITAASTPEGKKFRYVFLHCSITGEAPEHSYYLGRPWRPYAKSVFLYCSLRKVIAPAGWDNWQNTANEKTAFYAEYKNNGEGSPPAARVPWSHQLTDDEARAYTVETIFQDWNPKS